MKQKIFLWLATTILLCTTASYAFSPDEPKPPKDSTKAEMAKFNFSLIKGKMRNGHFKDVIDLTSKFLTQKPALLDTKQLIECVNFGVHARRRFGKDSLLDDFLESAAKNHSKNWMVLFAIATQYQGIPHQGYIFENKFTRGHSYRRGGKSVYCMRRDRVRALQLMKQADNLIQEQVAEGELSEFAHNSMISFYVTFAQQFRNYSPWKMTVKTDLSKLPIYDENYYYEEYDNRSPVDEKGNPIFWKLPKSWEAAENDGQRWRYLLRQSTRISGEEYREKINIADYARQVFGVRTMQSNSWFMRYQSDSDDDKKQASIYALDSLKDDETIAMLSNGIKRFKLPGDYNYIATYKKYIKGFEAFGKMPKNSKRDTIIYNAISSSTTLANIYNNRRLYPQAASVLQNALEYISSKKEYEDSARHIKSSLKQITGNWGQFQPVQTELALDSTKFGYRFRNGKKVTFTAQKLDLEKLLKISKDNIKKYYKALDKRGTYRSYEWNYIQPNIYNIFSTYANAGRKKIFQSAIIKEPVAKWSINLKPRKNHFDKQIEVTAPIKDPGAYIITGEMENGNKTYILMWVADTVMISKPMSNGKRLYYVADAKTGKPLKKMNVEFLGYRFDQNWDHESRKYYYDKKLRNFAEYTDKNGMVYLEDKDNLSWLAIARNEKGRLAYIGFDSIYIQKYDAYYSGSARVFGISDRPIYKPGDTVNFKFWINRSRYDSSKNAYCDFRGFPVNVTAKVGSEVLFKKRITLDKFGGFNAKFTLPADAKLGMHNIYIDLRTKADGHITSGYINYRIEEYKKPEYEVKIDAPAKPVKLGEKFNAVVKAKYYFGAPVTNARVKYKVLRSDYDNTWYPVRNWDWLYGNGYWWGGYDYSWYRGFSKWGTCRPYFNWYGWWHPQPEPEVVAKGVASINEKGEFNIPIDTAVTKALHGDTDHRYQIQAEVIDSSRRTIVANGAVLVAREPFKIFSWTNRGYYRSGDVVEANFQARTIAGKPVEGKGELKLIHITYDDKRKPVEKVLETWKINTDFQGRVSKKIKAAKPGQYRLSYSLTDKANHTIEGATIVTIWGVNAKADSFRFNDLELIPSKGEFKPGEKLKLRVNTARKNSTVLLFPRPVSGVYLKPVVMKLDGRSAEKDFTIAKKDMPNIFMEAVTISNGRIFTEVKRIAVPPEKRILNVDLKLDKKNYKPGEKAKVKVKITDQTGEPVQADIAMTMYDKALEYISGGANTGDIKKFYWSWLRWHRPNTRFSNLKGYSGEFAFQGQRMSYLGAFGYSNVFKIFGDADDECIPEGRLHLRYAYTKGCKEKRASEPACMTDCDTKCASDKVMESAAVQRDGKVPATENKKSSAGGAPDIHVRKNFADTAKWVGRLVTGKDGKGEIEITMPENLTTWNAKLWAMSTGTRVGYGETSVITTKDLIVRLQAPRFFVESDQVCLSAIVHNYTDKPVDATIDLKLGGKTLKLVKGQAPTHVASIPANGEVRIDWMVKAVREGNAQIAMLAKTAKNSDAMEMEFPVYVHGMLKTDSYCNVVRPNDKQKQITINVPARRRPLQSRLEVRYSPTLAGAMIEALPYFAEYPYGCTEQTLNRFLPVVVTQKVIQRMGVKLEDLQNATVNLNAQEIGKDKARIAQWKRWKRNPVYNTSEVAKMVKVGVNRLSTMQNNDGGWGWFYRSNDSRFSSSPHTTAVVLHGLLLAKSNDVAIIPGVIKNGRRSLENYLRYRIAQLANKDPKHKYYVRPVDALVFMVLTEAGSNSRSMKAFEKYLMRDRGKLSPYALSLAGLALHQRKSKKNLKEIVSLIKQYVVTDEENQTAYVRIPNQYRWWYWYSNDIETQAFYLKLLTKIEPKGKTAAYLVKYLLNNRKNATYWNSTRDTSYCLEAFADFMKVTGEDKPDMTIEVLVDNKLYKSVKVDKSNLFTFDNKLVIEGAALKTGKHTVTVRRKGKGAIYFSAYQTNFTLENYITKAGLEVKVRRNYYKLVEADVKKAARTMHGRSTSERREHYKRIKLENPAGGNPMAQVKSGDLIEVELIVESKNDYEYLMLQDFKPAGFEAVKLRSGYIWQSGLGAYMEMRSNRVCFFMTRLPRGKYQLTYRVRAEIPGKFSALPARIEAMYAPELKGNSNEFKTQIKDLKLIRKKSSPSIPDQPRKTFPRPVKMKADK